MLPPGSWMSRCSVSVVSHALKARGKCHLRACCFQVCHASRQIRSRPGSYSTLYSKCQDEAHGPALPDHHKQKDDKDKKGRYLDTTQALLFPGGDPAASNHRIPAQPSSLFAHMLRSSAIGKQSCSSAAAPLRRCASVGSIAPGCVFYFRLHLGVTRFSSFFFCSKRASNYQKHPCCEPTEDLFQPRIFPNCMPGVGHLLVQMHL